MERRLILLRHAKSDWKAGAPDNHSRPLNRRGRSDAPRVAAHLAALGWVPELVVGSDSARTTETWDRMEPELGPVPVELTRGLYHGGLRELQAHAGGWADHVGTVLALGHNPGWADALARLSGRSERFTTGNAALLSGRGDSWQLALDGAWRLEGLLRPKELPL